MSSKPLSCRRHYTAGQRLKGLCEYCPHCPSDPKRLLCILPAVDKGLCKGHLEAMLRAREKFARKRALDVI